MINIINILTADVYECLIALKKKNLQSDSSYKKYHFIIDGIKVIFITVLV